jgi:hypothetical protein
MQSNAASELSRRSVQSQADFLALPTQLIPVAFRRKSTFLYFYPRDT